MKINNVMNILWYLVIVLCLVNMFIGLWTSDWKKLLDNAGDCLLVVIILMYKQENADLKAEINAKDATI